MKYFLGCIFLSALFVGCGGGSDAAVDIATKAPTSISSPTSTLCAFDVGANRLEGYVSSVHDGDTITLVSSGISYKVRLDSIDAPELAQPYGDSSQSNLANAVLGKIVKVAYTKTDQYDRIVGAVFTGGCDYVNLSQVVSGSAWFYKAYQCEVSAAIRDMFSQAQDGAVNAKIGLWSQPDPEAPWFYRNGTEPVTPTCSSNLPMTSGTIALSTVGLTTAGNTSTTTPVWNGTTASTKTCYTGPRGGTYTLTASGNKNYSGC